MNRYRVEHADEEPPLTISERARLRELEKENRELKMKAEFWEKRLPSSPRNIGRREICVYRRGEGALSGEPHVRLVRSIPVRVLWWR